jgi:hypothetical protein
MKLLFIISATILAFSGPLWADEDSGSEATVAAPSYDPTKEDCKCLKDKTVVLPDDNQANIIRKARWIANQPPGTPEPAGSSTTFY